MEDAAYLQTTKSTHICIWIQTEAVKTDAGRLSYGYAPATLCGWKKENFRSRAKVLYPDLDGTPKYPLCRTCVQVANSVVKLGSVTSPVIEVVQTVENNLEEEDHA